ncbi:Tic 56 protein [Thalictrum thalictroides]|uniref:Tic 56 protein n=1 Tax=Thalictrum thalictroides TaxID=46969 RepID=A0A7J6VXI8_THATH|nr:Tic 56 protein [Thalictrum thalictroides]
MPNEGPSINLDPRPRLLGIQLAKAIPGLRPWEVLSIEQAMDQITYGGEWYREPLGSYTTGPPYIRRWNRDMKNLFKTFLRLSYRVFSSLEETIPGFRAIVEKVNERTDRKIAQRVQRRAAEKRAEEEINLYGRRISDD